MTNSNNPRTTNTGWRLLYEYTADLMCLDFCRPPTHNHSANLQEVSTPLILQTWSVAQEPHPDRAFADYILRGLQEGFRIGFRQESPLRSAKTNMLSALQHPEVIDAYLGKELALGRLLGPFTPGGEELQGVHINRFGVIPKGHNTGKWRLITDLSYPQDRSVNDGIDPALCSLKYTSVDQVAETIATLGQGSLLAKIDVESAYRLIPVHPDDRLLQTQFHHQILSTKLLPLPLEMKRFYTASW